MSQPDNLSQWFTVGQQLILYSTNAMLLAWLTLYHIQWGCDKHCAGTDVMDILVPEANLLNL